MNKAMIPIHFHAAWNNIVRKFQVTVTLNERRLVELMRPKRFKEFVGDINNGFLCVGKTSIKFNEDDPIPHQLVTYFNQVLQSYESRNQ